MRRRLQGFVPELAHYYGLLPWMLDDLTGGEVDELLDRLRKAPPIGGFVQYHHPNDKRR